MPRPKKSASSSRVAQNASLNLSELHLRLAALEKDHQSLLKQIKKKRTELNNFVEQMRSLATQLFHKITPSFQKMAALDKEIHALFDEILSRKFGKQSKKDIQAIYETLQRAGIVSPKEDSPDADTELDELFENSDEEEDFSEEQRKNYHHQQTPHETASADRSDNSRKVRQTFLKLAEIFHPDKVTDSETQMRHTEIMKEINKAYQEGDIARLLEIEQKYQVGESIDPNSEDDLTRRCDRLEQQNEILKSQYDNLKRELRLVKNTPEGAMVSDHRKAGKQGIDLMDEMLEEVDAQVQIVADVRNFVKEFRDKKMTIKDFLRGPEIFRTLQRKMIETMFGEMFDEDDEDDDYF